jgi:ribosome-binding ATPase YchF (GTP1/OBG family)
MGLPQSGKSALFYALSRGFIRAKVMAFDELIAAGTWDAAKAAGKRRLEGLDYPVKDGGIIHTRFKV